MKSMPVCTLAICKSC